MKKYDVTVIGGGPGGAMTAITLAEQGCRVLLVEKHAFPRHKPCGGAVSVKAQELLDFPLESLSRNAVCHARLGMVGGPVAEIKFDAPLIHLVHRKEFDFHLIQIAVSKGADVHDRERFVNLEQTSTGSVVRTDKGAYMTQYVVGADGALSRVRSHLGLGWKPLLGITLEGEFFVTGSTPTWADGAVTIDLAYPDNGYSWIFPKEDVLSIGLGTCLPRLPGVKHMMEEYLRIKGLNLLQPLFLQGSPIPADGAVKKMLHNNKLGVLVGDAAGLVDSFTGEGIYYALLSGRIAGEELAKSLQSGRRDLSGYSRRIYREITTKLRGGAKLASLVYQYPRQGLELVAARPELGQALLRAICGRQSYNNLYLSLLPVILWRRLKTREGIGYPLSK